MISIIAAYDRNGGIGQNGRLPWPRMAADKARFHQLIHQKNILMGAKTYSEFHRAHHAFSVKNAYVLSRQLSELPDAVVLNNVQSVIDEAARSELCVIGGAEIYQLMLPLADTMYLTVIDGSFQADTFFPQYDSSDWKVVEEQSFPADTENPYPYTFLTLKTLKEDSR